MLKILEFQRDGASLLLSLDSTGMRIRFQDNKNHGLICIWNLTGYPKDFIRAAKQASGNSWVANRFDLWIREVYYPGGFDSREETELPVLHFTEYEGGPEIRIPLRKTEIAKLIQVLDDYWTC